MRLLIINKFKFKIFDRKLSLIYKKINFTKKKLKTESSKMKNLLIIYQNQKMNLLKK